MDEPSAPRARAAAYSASRARLLPDLGRLVASVGRKQEEGRVDASAFQPDGWRMPPPPALEAARRSARRARAGSVPPLKGCP